MTEEQYRNPAVSGLATEETAPDLLDLAAPTEGAGSWPRGWYRALVLPGYATGKGTAFETRDLVAKDPSSRNLFICFEIQGDVLVPTSRVAEDRKLKPGPGGVRKIRATFNYRPTDLTERRIAEVKAARERFKGVQGRWPDAAIQASSLSLARFGQLQEALGFKLPFNGRQFDASIFVGQRFDIRLDVDDEKGFNEVAAVAKAGEKVK